MSKDVDCYNGLDDEKRSHTNKSNLIDALKVYEVAFPNTNTLSPTTPETILGGMKEDSTRAIRYDQNKPHMDLLSPIAMFGTAQVLTKGLEKYPGSQWKKGMAWSKVIASLLRHLFKFMAGEELDEESKLPHIDHVAANVMFLQEYYRKHKELDDRIKTGLE